VGKSATSTVDKADRTHKDNRTNHSGQNPPTKQIKTRESLPTKLLTTHVQQMDPNQGHQVKAKVEALAEHKAKPDDPETPKPGKPKRNKTNPKVPRISLRE
jgi:hypothetical protein